MKKILLSLVFAGGAFMATAQQTSVQVLYPSSIAQGFTHDFATSTTNPTPWTNTPDMTDPNNKVIAPIMIARDNGGVSGGDSLMCNATSQDLTGKIAVLWRGNCEFGLKAKNAWDAGAAGVIIVNNVDGAPVGMAAGVSGGVVTVPVVMISKADGEILRTAKVAGDSVSVLLGNKLGYMKNDLGSILGYTATVAAQVPVQIANNTTEFPIRFAAQVYNYGENEATNVYVTAVINKNGSELYRDTSDIVATLAPGDSIENFTFINYSGDLGVGDYEIIYEIVSDSTDDATTDNHFSYPFRINNDKIFALAQYDYTTNFTLNSGNFRAADQADPSFQSCITFQDPNASKFGIKGVYFQASITNDDQGNAQSIDGEEILISISEWNDNFTFGTDDPSWNNVVPVTGGSYIYMEDLADTFVYANMNEYILLKDNVRYLICSKTSNEDIFLGYDSERKYDFYQSITERYLSPFQAGNTWGAGFVGMPVASLTLDLFTEDEVGLANTKKLVAAKVYPNPARDIVNIEVSNYEGTAALTVTDLAGKVVISNNVTVNANGVTTVNTSGLTAGMYIVKMQLANGNQVNASIIVE
ncbi:MAG TPA: T9SS type A sorting domain-containing protein [Crocinitomicaceae bacterium]|nr:T9SS type A sorting domain-containing protein [Crocinitomicaceae bacterium]